MGIRYPEKADTAIAKYARYKTEDEKNDLRQQCYLALLEQSERVSSPAIAYLICRDVVYKELRKEIRRDGEVSLADTSIIYETENKFYTTPEYFLDRPALSKALNELTLDESTVIIHLYGLIGPRKSLKDVAEMHNKTIWWVREVVKSGMDKLKSILGAKDGRQHSDNT